MWKINYQRLFKMIAVAIILLSPFYYVVLAGDQIHSNTFLVGSGSQTGQISSQVDLPVTLFIGNDLTGVTSPVKSSFFKVSGVYTGGGSLQFKVNGDNASAKTFTLPTVSRPTDFELIYKDDSGIINPSSAGTYNYTLNVIPSGVTISGLASKLEVTYQFAPSSCVDGNPTNEKVKTTEFFVSQLNNFGSSNSLPVSLYIGDNLEGVASPVKSVYFIISGVYTGSGILTADLNSAGTENFSMPFVSNPTNFNFIYRDSTGQINPTSAGTYSYTLNLSQTGLTISNFNAKAILTYRYKPVSCGLGYPPYGDLISAVYDATSNSNGAAYNSIMWKGVLGGESFDKGQVLFQLAASDNSSGPWNYVGGETCGSSDWFSASPNTPVSISCFSELNNKRYFRYKIRICSDDCILGGNSTPKVDDVVVNFSP